MRSTDVEQAMIEADCRLGAAEHIEEFPGLRGDRIGDYVAGFRRGVLAIKNPGTVEDLGIDLALMKARYIAMRKK